MINRKDFVKNCVAAVCATGLCSQVKTFGAQASDEKPQSCDSKEFVNIRDKADAAHLRFSKLIEILETRLPEDERKQALHALGAKCADTYKATLINRYIGNIKGFLEEGRRNWMAEADYDEVNGTIRIVDKGPGCSCPMTKEGVTPPSFCDCTLGWQVEVYSTILERPVTAELEESILRGGKKCIFQIKVI